MNEENLREKIALEIENKAKAGDITCDNDLYWVAGMEYAAKIVRGQV